MVTAPKGWIYPDGEQPRQVEQPWKLPAVLTAQQITEARRELVHVDAALKPAAPAVARQWLIALATLCAGNMHADDARLKAGAYARMLGHPPDAFTVQSLREAARKFKFLPAFSEVSEFLDAQVAELTAIRARLDAIARAKPSAPVEEQVRRYVDMTPEEQLEHDRLMDDHWARSGDRPQRAQVPPTGEAPPRTLKRLIVRERPSCLDDAPNPEQTEALV